jgi:hypothetical protein
LQNTAKKILEWKYQQKKSEMMEFLGQDTVRYKIIVDTKCLRQVKNFQYLGRKIFCKTEKHFQQKK